jgi:hypothetical protein
VNAQNSPHRLLVSIASAGRGVRRWIGSLSWTRTVVALASVVVVGVVGAIIGLLLEDYRDSQKKAPFVAVILSNSDPNFTIPMELRQGMQEAGTTIPARNQQGVEIKYILTGLTAEDTREAVREGCLVHPNCIAIVGASDSTTTAAALREILTVSPDARPALIMPIATATSLTEQAARANYHQILRLVPNNADQAREIKSFIASRASSQRVTILIDPANPEYSGNLSAMIIQMVRDNGGDARQLQYVDSSTLAGTNFDDQDFIVFVGTSSNGLEVIHDMIRNDIRVPIIFTDGNTVREVIRRSQSMPGPAYFLTPVEELNDFSEPGYTAIGRDTWQILSSIFSEAPRLSRDGVAEFVSDNRYEIELTSGSAGDYRFGQDGENSKMHFRIFSLDGGQVRMQRGY